MDFKSAIDLINSQGRRSEDPPIIILNICSICGMEYARLPQDVALSKKNGTPVLCNVCMDNQRKSQRRNSLYHSRKNGLGWKHALGIAFPKNDRTSKGHGPYTAIMHRFELWLQNEKGYKDGEELESDLITPYRKEFFDAHIDEEGLFSTQELKKIQHYGEEVYVCTGCQAQMAPSYFAQCCPSKKSKSK